MADIASQASFSVMTESGEMRSMTPEEINAFVRQQIELASSRKSSMTTTQQSRRMRLARTPSPLGRFGRTNPLLQKTTDSKSKNVDSISTDFLLDESSQRGASTTPKHRLSSTSLHSPPQMIQHVRPTLSSTCLVQSMSPIHLRGSMEDEKRSLSVDRQRQSISPDRRDGIEEKRNSQVEFDFDSGRKTIMEKHPNKKSELRIDIYPTPPEKVALSPEYSGGRSEASFSRDDEPVIIRRRSPSQTDRKLKKAARNKASRRRADLFTVTRTTAFDTEPFDENDQYSQISDAQATLLDSSMEISQKTLESLKDTREIVTPREKKKLMSQPEIDILIKHSMNKARKARKIAATDLERKEKQQKDFEPKSRFDEVTGMSPLGGRNRRFSWSSVEDLDDVSTLDGAKSPKAALEINGRHSEKAEITYATTTRSDMLTTRSRLPSTKTQHDQVTPAESESKPKEIIVPSNNIAVRENDIKKLPEGLTISTVPSPLDVLSPLNIPSITSDRIYSQDEISAIVLLSMEKAQQAARNEIKYLLLTPKANDPKSPIAAKLAARLRVPSQEEVTSIAREAMHRAREAAQDEIRTLIRESFRCAQDSSQEQIRQIVRDSMQRARASAREEMSELVRNILRQGMDTQPKSHHKAVFPERIPGMIAAKKLLVSKDFDRAAIGIGSFAATSPRPSQQSSQPKLERSENEETEEKESETATSFAADNEQIADENGSATALSTELPSRYTFEHRLSSSVSESVKSLGLDTCRTPRTKFSFSQVDTHDEDQQPLPESQPHSQQPVQENVSTNSQLSFLQDTRVQSVPVNSVCMGTWNHTSANIGDIEIGQTTPACENDNSSDQTTGALPSMTKVPADETSCNQIAYGPLSPAKTDNQEEMATEDGDREDEDDAPEKRPAENTEGLLSVVDSPDKHACEAFAAGDSSMIASNDGPSLSLSVPDETPVESRRRSEKPTKRENAVRRRKTRASRARYVSGMKSPSASMTPSDASTHSSCSVSEGVESTTSSDSRQSRRKSRKNRYRSSKNEAVVTDEFLQLIASKKGKRITAKDLGELIKQQQQISSPRSENDNRLRKRSGIRGSQSFQARPRASFDKQPRFCMVGNFMNFWEDLDLFLEEEGSDYQGNEILSFSTREGSYTEFEDDDIEESFTEEARFDPSIVVSFSLQPSEEDESFVSEEEDVPKRRGWW